MRPILAVAFVLSMSVGAPFAQDRGGGPPALGPLGMKGNLPPGENGVPHGVPAPTAAQIAMIAAVKAFEEACDAAAVTGDTAFLEKALAPTFIMTHGDSWLTGESPIKVDTKQQWIEYVAKKPGPYVYRKLDAVKVELHGDVAITIGRYDYLPRSANPNAANSGTHLYVWFERVYAYRNGQWQFLSHRTVSGPGRALDSGTEMPLH